MRVNSAARARQAARRERRGKWRIRQEGKGAGVMGREGEEGKRAEEQRGREEHGRKNHAGVQGRKRDTKKKMGKKLVRCF